MLEGVGPDELDRVWTGAGTHRSPWACVWSVSPTTACSMWGRPPTPAGPSRTEPPGFVLEVSVWAA